MSQKSLFPNEPICLPFNASDYARWLAEQGIKEPLSLEARFKEAFPTLDLLTEGRKAMAWNESLPPTFRKRAIPKFLYNWYSRRYVMPTQNQRQASIAPSRKFKDGYVRTNEQDPDEGS